MPFLHVALLRYMLWQYVLKYFKAVPRGAYVVHGKGVFSRFVEVPPTTIKEARRRGMIESVVTAGGILNPLNIGTFPSRHRLIFPVLLLDPR